LPAIINGDSQCIITLELFDENDNLITDLIVSFEEQTVRPKNQLFAKDYDFKVRATSR
jgi:hypothetical protein